MGAGEAYIGLLRGFLKQRAAVVESIECLLSAQRAPEFRAFEDCFFARAALPADYARLRGKLEDAYCAGGFKPRQVQHLYNDLIDPAEMAARAFHCWQLTRRPGRNGRLHYAHTLFNVYVLRCLQFLSLRIWDETPGKAGERLAEVQSVLDALWSGSPAGQPAFVRDARWLIPLAQSLITDELAPYFEIARLVSETLPPADVLEIQKAHVRMLGGHLTSQIRYYCTKDGLPIGERSVVLRTRNTNALDFALLVQGLVDLLKAYDGALRSGDERTRLDMASAIFQGVSPDPELFLNRLDLLRAYTMMERVFIAVDREGRAEYSPAGRRHTGLIEEYGARIERLLQPLREDFPRFRPVEGCCSPYGVIFGLPSTLIEHMALKAIQHDAETRFSLEDVFRDEDTGGEKLAWVNGWRDLPHIPAEVQRQYDYPQRFAEEIYERIGSELGGGGAATGRLYIGPEGDAEMNRYFVSSDRQIVAAGKAEPYDQAQLLRERQEGLFLVSYETSGGWAALRKDLLTEVLGAGRDARAGGLPKDAAEVLRLMCEGRISVTK